MISFRTSTTTARVAARAAATLLLAAGLTAGQLASADAHVRVSADSPTSGSFSALTFRVPNESDTAGTTKISITLPQDTPFLYVSTRPVPGWTARSVEQPLPRPVEVDGTTITTAVRTVTWTAASGTRIGPGEYQEFAISVGPLPAAGTVLLPATQTYSDGKVVRWDEPTPASGDEPEHPAPAIEVLAATPAPAGSAGTPATPEPGNDADAATAAPDAGARGLAALALGVGVAALVVAGLSLRRRTASNR